MMAVEHYYSSIGGSITKQFNFSPKINNLLRNVIRITSIFRFKLEIAR
ncbi:Serine/threonine protein phosphatase PP1 isozyme 1, putative [Brugia malayi]|uniref:Bm277 n=1 Tax=Brugia malayi TaxID=6279 RepID=A0A0J9XNI6_BRUMA|nr:Serine/threonine protein phosphatase PP1 isozyme 1, putative [Brugia malayi]CDP92422.1 Bm277 [Brugia malayi]VIO99895.1 Serine/threonine protein phosphatase PP1 isozyme 1, putative [Brugia malayi]